MPHPELSDLRRRRRRIQDELSTLGDLRPGSLLARYRKCGKPNCRCAAERDPGHGPSWSLTWTVEGKTQTRVIPVSAVETQAQLAEYRRARSLTRELFEVSARLCDVQLEVVKAAQEKGLVAAVEPAVGRARRRSCAPDRRGRSR